MLHAECIEMERVRNDKMTVMSHESVMSHERV